MSREAFEDGASSRYDELLDEFTNLAINRFSWEGLPIGLTSEQLENLLIRYGKLLYFNDKNYGEYLLPCHSVTDINVYGLATDYNVNALNGKYTKTISLDEAVLLKNNPLGTPDISTLEIFAKRIDDVEMTQDVNLFQQCIPKVVLADEDGKLTAKNLIDKIRKFKFVVFGRKSLANIVSSSDVLDTSSPYVLDKLQQHKTDLKNELLTYLGLNNNNNVKKERMIVDEVNANNDYIQTMLDLMYDIRENFCKEVNEKFGTSITVKKREVKTDGGNNLPTGGTN